MDTDSFFQAVKNALPFGLPFPGNSDGETRLVDLAGDSAQRIGGSSNSTWSTYVSNARSIVTYPYRVAHGAYTEVRDAAARARDFTVRAQDAAVQAATGFATWTKWAVVGLLALAALYFLALVSPIIPRGRA